MPVYAFTCVACGGFDVVRPMAESDELARAAVADERAPARRALELEEKSAHEPEVVTQKRGRPMPQRHAPSPPWAVGH